ncbi:MAG: sulfatase-like hydrolase/transferase [Thermoanaerobaculia bacterium]
MSLRPMVGLLLAAAGLIGCVPGSPSRSAPAHRPPARLDPLPAGAAGPSDCPGGGGAGIAPVVHRTATGRSWRRGFATCRGAERLAVVEAGDGALLELSVGWRAPGAGRSGAKGSAAAILQVIPAAGGAEGSRVVREVLSPGSGWVERTVEIPPGRSELRFRSEGSGVVVWGDLFLRPERARPAPGTRTRAQRRARDPAAGRRPNVVLVSLDTLRADHLSLYAYSRETSPELEAIARDALVFDRALASATWTLPSTATLLTGLLPVQHGLHTPGDRLAEGAQTLAERLADAGYRTAAFTDGGFLSHEFGLGGGFGRYDTTGLNLEEPKDAADTLEPAAAWAVERGGQPFFLFVQTYETHQPYVNRDGFADPFLDPGYRGALGERVQVDPRELRPAGPDLERVAALYDGEVARVDHFLGRFWRRLQEAGLDRTTALVVTSDHGEELMEHGDLEHAFGKVFDPHVRVPLVVRPPGGAPAQRIAAPVSGVDVAPTLLELADPGADLQAEGLPGRSLLQVAGATEGAGGGRDRTVVVQGRALAPEIEERRVRLEGSEESVICERKAGRLLRYERARDRALPAGSAASGTEVGRRLPAVLAWLTPEAFAVRLPEGRSVAVPPGSPVAPRGVWSGCRWTVGEGGAGGGWRATLPAGGPAYLVFEERGAGSGETPWELRLEGGSERPWRRLALRSPDAPSWWNPLEGPLPSAGVVLRTATPRPPARAAVDEETRRDLEALGYLD